MMRGVARTRVAHCMQHARARAAVGSVDARRDLTIEKWTKSDFGEALVNHLERLRRSYRKIC